MSNPPSKLPDLFQGKLDRAQVTHYLDDLADLDTPVEIQVKFVDSSFADKRVTLDELRQEIAQQALLRAQLRYRYDGRSWCDSLLFTIQDDGVRLIRLCQDG